MELLGTTILPERFLDGVRRGGERWEVVFSRSSFEVVYVSGGNGSDEKTEFLLILQEVPF